MCESGLHFLLWSKSNPKHQSNVRRSTVNSLLLDTTNILVLIYSGVASPKILGGKTFGFRRITLFCLEKRLSKHKMTIFSKNLVGAMAHFAPTPWLRLCWYRNDSVREALTTSIALVCNNFLLLLCNNFNDTLTSLTYFPFSILSICFLYIILWQVSRELPRFSKLARWSKVVWLYFSTQQQRGRNQWITKYAWRKELE